MSMSRGCMLVERHPGKWFCLVASDEYDYDFQGNYSVYGPKPTADDAFDEMHRHEPNPGHSNEVPHNRLTPQVIALIDTELERMKKSQITGVIRW